MAKKVFLQDLDEKLLPITRGELVLDSSGKEAFHSEEFLASTTLPGLMSAEDKIRLNLLKAQSIPLIEGPDTDTTSKWTGTYDGITEYSHGMCIWYVPYKSFMLTTTLNINNLGEKSVKIVGGGQVLSGYPNLLVYDSVSDSWFFCDIDTDTYYRDIPLVNTVDNNNGYIYYYIAGKGATILTSNPGYIVLCNNNNTINLENITKIAIGSNSISQYRKPVVFTSTTGEMGKGYHIAYYDGETVYINTDGVIPGIIEKARIAETVEWNEVEGDNEDVSIRESSVTNSLYLYTHDLTNISKKPSEYKNQYLTSWFSKTDMPLTQTFSGINISSSSNNVNWQLCSLASNTYDSAYDRLWFRSGIGESWNSWQQVAFANDLLTRGMGINLSAGDDLNSLDTGIYYSADSSISEQLTNSPTSESGFKLIALAGYEAPNVYGAQLAYSDTNFFWRLKQDNTDNLDWYSWIKFKQGEAVGSPTTPMYIDETGTLRAINCSIQASVPSNAQFTDTRCTSLSMPIKPEAETISDESEVVGVLKADSISASGDGTYLSGLLSYVNVPTENFVKKTFKVKQTYVGSPNSTGAATEFIDTITQDTNGKINATKKYIPKASSWLPGIIQVGDNLETDSNGVLSAVGYTYLDDGSFIEGNITEYYAEDYSHIEGLHLDLGQDFDGNVLPFTLYKVPFDDISMKFSETISPVLDFLGLGPDALQTNLYIAHSDYDELTDIILYPNNYSSFFGLTYNSGYGQLIHVSSGSSYTGMMFYLNSTGLDSQPNVYRFVITWSPITDSYLGNTFHFHTTHSVALVASHSEGISGVSMIYGHSEGMGSLSSLISHAEGKATAAISFSHSEGMTTYSDYISHAEGFGSSAVNISHAEGALTLALNGSHAEGYGTVSSGKASHAEGNGVGAIGEASHAEGFCTRTNNLGEHAQGKFNISNYDPDDLDPAYQTISSIGIGNYTGNNPYDESNATRKNAFEVMVNGDAYLVGVGGYDGTNPTTATTLQTVINNLNGSSGTGDAIPVATDTVLGGVKLGYTESGADLAVKLDNEKAHVTLSKNAIVSALGFEPGTGSGEGSGISITPGIGLTGTTDDSAITSSGTINLKQADSSELGGVKIGFATNDSGKQYKLDVSDTGHAYTHVPWTDTKNTAGSNDTTEDLYIIGAQELGDNPQTYSHSEVKISGNAIKASGGFYQESDERLKDFHDDLLVDLEQLSNLPKKKFTWKSDDRKEVNIGTSAQELQKLYPELVKEDSNGTLSVAYDKLSIIALKAIDELYQRNIELERRIKELENK